MCVIVFQPVPHADEAHRVLRTYHKQQWRASLLSLTLLADPTVWSVPRVATSTITNAYGVRCRTMIWIVNKFTTILALSIEWCDHLWKLHVLTIWEPGYSFWFAIVRYVLLRHSLPWGLSVLFCSSSVARHQLQHGSYQLWPHWLSIKMVLSILLWVHKQTL